MNGRSRGLLAATVCLLELGACSAPEEHTDLRPAGAPEVLTVLVSNSTDGFLETATFCKVGDNKRPGLIPANPDFDNTGAVNPAQICSDDLTVGADMVTDTIPVNWYVRIQFDELLNPDIEELVPIIQDGKDTGRNKGSLSKSQPVTVTCGGGAEVLYDGYYDPSGNSFSWPPGPSLFIQPSDSSTIPTGSECQVTIKPDVVVDKDGIKVPMTELGPYPFKIAELAIASTEPSAADLTSATFKPEKIAPDAPLVVTFNAFLDRATLDPTKVVAFAVDDCKAPTTMIPVVTVITTHEVGVDAAKHVDQQSVEITDAAAAADAAWVPGTTYLISFDGTVKDQAGGVGTLPSADDLTVCFTATEETP
jgi:hypothetical protein